MTDVYTSGPLQGRPFRGSRALTSITPPPLSQADRDRFEVLHDDYHACAGDPELTDATIDASAPDDGDGPEIEWSEGGGRSSTRTAVVTLMLMGAVILYFGLRMLGAFGPVAGS